MNSCEWNAFCDFRQNFKNMVDLWSTKVENLQELQKQAALEAKTPLYSFENPVVYNTDLDKITESDEIKLIVIGDNPGKNEQLNSNKRYLCGQSGKLAENFFKRNPELNVDFRKNVIILNKTPVHSAKTNQLKTMIKHGGKQVLDLINESQLWMAENTAILHQKLENTQVWLVGYSELKRKGFFELYKNELKASYKNCPEKWDEVLVFQHFSMNCFNNDLNKFITEDKKNVPLFQILQELGTFHKNEIFND